MKILQVCQSFYPCFASGGVVRSVYEVSKKLVERGHDVTVYTTDGCTKRLEGSNHESFDVEGIEVFYLKNLSNMLKLKFKISNPYYLPFKARKDLKKFDIIHIHEYRSFLSIVIHYYAKKYEIPYILQARGSVMPFFQKTRLKKIFDYLWGYDILKDAKLVLALTPNESLQYQKMSVDLNKIKIIPNGIDISTFSNVKRGIFKKKYNIPDDVQIILFLGRIHKIKGIDLLIEAFNNLTIDLTKVMLVIVGPDDGFMGDLKLLVRKYEIEDKIIFTGPLYDNLKLEAYMDADVYILPSVYDAFPNTVMEAMCLEKPVILTEGCQIDDVVKDNVGLKVKCNVNSLQNAMKIILSDEEYRQQLGKNGKKIVVEKYSLNKVVGDIEKTYKDLAKI